MRTGSQHHIFFPKYCLLGIFCYNLFSKSMNIVFNITQYTQNSFFDYFYFYLFDIVRFKMKGCFLFIFGTFCKTCPILFLISFYFINKTNYKIMRVIFTTLFLSWSFFGIFLAILWDFRFLGSKNLKKLWPNPLRLFWSKFRKKSNLP